MDWIFDNLQILLFIAAGIAYSINSLRQAKAELEDERNREQQPVDLEEIFGPDFDFNSPPDRQPQTEVINPPPLPSIQPNPQSPPATPRVKREFPQAGQSPQYPESPHQKSPALGTIETELERQRTLEQKILALRQNRESRNSGAAATQRSVAAKNTNALTAKHQKTTTTENLRSRLRNPKETRRAIVLREILGAPVGMR